MIIPIPSAKLSVVFPQRQLPSVDFMNLCFSSHLGGVKIVGQVNAKSARKLSSHQGSAVLQGKMIRGASSLELIEAGFSFLYPRPVETTVEVPELSL